MKNSRAILFPLLVASLAVASCHGRAERSSGAVLLEITSVSTVPPSQSVITGTFQIGTVVLQNFPKDPTTVGFGDHFQDVELRSYEVTYRRRDTGTRVPPPLTARIGGTVPVNSTDFVPSLPFLTSDQLLSPPLSDLSKFGRDTETGSAIIVLDVSLRFFGRTISGDDVASQTASFTIEVTP
jgi:hypothetical protein